MNIWNLQKLSWNLSVYPQKLFHYNLKTIAAFLWGESTVFTNFYTNMDNIDAKSISFCMTISIHKGQFIKVIGP